jgi:hypothetical protein
VDWATADRIGLCEHKSREVFTDGVYPVSSVVETGDPVALGFENNLELCAFHWVLRRFVDATKYCLVSASCDVAKARTAVSKWRSRRTGHTSATSRSACTGS